MNGRSPAEATLRPGRRRTRLAALAAVLLMTTATGCAADAARTDSIPSPSGDDAATPPPTGTQGGWIAFSADWNEDDVMLVRPGEEAHRAVGADDDGMSRSCPAFEPQGARLAFGTATGSWETGWTDVALSIAVVTAAGEAAVVKEIPLEGFTERACPIWSADGRWIAVGTAPAGPTRRGVMTEILIIDPESGDIVRLPETTATDFEWAPDGDVLYIADERGVLAYSLADGGTRTIDDTPVAQALSVSPDGQTLAVERRKYNAAERYDLVLMDSDGSDQRVIAADYSQMHGLGPVWSPDGAHVVFQRSCETITDDSGETRPCREEHDVVIADVSGADPTQAVVERPTARNDGAAAPWFPYSVTWSPDSSTLLYLGWSCDVNCESYVDGLIAVPVADSTQTVVLYETTDAIDAYPASPMNNFQSWAG
ncbi:hypothetical protein [Microbacterium sp. SS28]|uniref:hypothetical protein n=1 Tax=Microbacterium sp. SS28 TaxID=2919948 RepID=UPI001FAA6387|nr:hypothetical protein [Microbacterium sp. SS28]